MNMLDKYRIPLFNQSSDGAAGGGSAPPAPATTPSAPAGPSGDAAPSGTSDATPAPSVPGGGTQPLRTAPRSVGIAPDDPDDSDADPFGALFGIDGAVGAASGEAVIPGGETIPPEGQLDLTVVEPPQSVAEGTAPKPPAAPGQQQLSEPTAPPVQGESPTGQAPSLNLLNPQQFAQALTQLDANAMNAVSEQFRFSEEEWQAFETDPREALPQLAAKLYTRILSAAVMQIGRLTPHMIDTHVATREATKSAEDRFYDRWKGLDRTKHGDQVKKLGWMWRQMNPKATTEQMVEALGPLAHAMLQIPAPASGTGNSVPVARSPLAPAGMRSQVSPFVPAVGGPGGVPQPKPNGADDNPWAGLGMDYGDN